MSRGCKSSNPARKQLLSVMDLNKNENLVSQSIEYKCEYKK